MQKEFPAGIRFVVVLALAIGLLGGTKTVFADDPPLLEGTWLVFVQLRNCSTQAPLGPPFMSVVTFHQGGTLSELSGGAAFAPGQRSPGTGTWARIGARTYVQRVAALIAFTTPPNPPASPGFEAGGQTITHTVEVSDGRNFTSSGTTAFYRTGEFTPYRTGCSTATGQRF